MKITITPIMKKPEIGDIVMNDCDTPYLFQWGEDDEPSDEEWPVAFSIKKAKAFLDSCTTLKALVDSYTTDDVKES